MSDKPLSARDISMERHTRLLMEATKQAIYKHGVRGATVGKIQELSGLSRGLVSTRFESKENLLLQAAKELSDEYTQLWKQALERAAPDPVCQLRAIIEADFSENVLNERSMALWFTFRAEAKSRVEYLPYIGTREEPMADIVDNLCIQIAMMCGQTESEGLKASRLLMTILEGFWVDYHLYAANFDREEAVQLCWHMVNQLFPSLSAEGRTER